MQSIKNLLKSTILYDLYREWKKLIISLREKKLNKKMFRFYRKFINKGDVVFDVGANIGSRTNIFLKLGAIVIAIEPQAYCVDILKNKYGDNPKFTLINKALAEKEGQAEMMISDACTISSLSKEWVEAVRKSGRFHNHNWGGGAEIVQTTTLDKLIDQYGFPSFIKIDVEGFEYEVIKGLSKPVNALSLEFTPEFIESTYNCIDYLSKIGKIQFNYSIGDSMVLSLRKWVSCKEISKLLSEFINDNKSYGDVYIRFI